jgi:hypothetical protein
MPQLSSFTKAEARDRCRGDLGLRSNNLLTDAEINAWLYEATKLIAWRTHWLRKHATAVNVTAGTAVYDLPADAIAIEEVRYLGDQLTRLSTRDLARSVVEWRDDSGTPSHYYLYGMTSLGLYPNPDTTTAGALVVSYAYFPAAPTTDADFYTVPTALDKVILDYAKLQASLKDVTGEGQHRVPYYEKQWLQGLKDIESLVGESGEGNLTVLGANADYDRVTDWPVFEVPV